MNTNLKRDNLQLWPFLVSPIYFLICLLLECVNPGGDGGGGGTGLPYITDGDAGRNLQKKPLKVTILVVAPTIFIP